MFLLELWMVIYVNSHAFGIMVCQFVFGLYLIHSYLDSFSAED